MENYSRINAVTGSKVLRDETVEAVTEALVVALIDCGARDTRLAMADVASMAAAAGVVFC